MERYLSKYLLEDLKRKMVFLAGPRQVGKSTLARSFLTSRRNYLSWDNFDGRTRILENKLPKKGLLVFDELHKYRKWRNYIKGVFDTTREHLQIIVTGSAKLDLYRYGGDSLQGRYHFWRLHPLSVAELKIRSNKDLLTLLTLSGFPEPFFSGSQKEAKRWSRDYRVRLIREDLQSIERVSDLGSLEVLSGHLPHLVGNPLSVNSIREQLQVSHQTVSKWLDALERLYGFFRVSPFGVPKIRAVKKEQKAYLFDWSLVPHEGARFENMVACHILKYVHFLQDSEGLEIDLRYYRDTTPREVDFIILKENRPWKAIECKLSEREISPHLKYFKSKFPHCECLQISFQNSDNYVSTGGIRVMPALEFLQTLV